MEILRFAAFTTDPAGGNPAGVVLDASGVDDAEMLRVAAEVGYSETAFLTPVGDTSPADSDASPEVAFEVRYFSPRVEVPFCGHATIAAAVAYSRRHGPGTLRFDTQAGSVRVVTDRGDSGALTATLTSVPPQLAPIADSDLAALLAALRWSPDDLDPALPPRVAYAGAWHPVIAARSRERLADLAYDMTGLATLMDLNRWITIDLVWRESERVFHARNPFPPGGVVEDPATGAAAAAFGGYLRELGLVRPPVSVTVHQGTDMGRPSVITVGIGPDPAAGIEVKGTATPIAET